MEFPRDINNLIIKKLDIDTRLKLGIITKFKRDEKFLHFTNSLMHKMSNSPKVEAYYAHEEDVYIELGDSRYVLFRVFNSETKAHNYDYVLHFDNHRNCTFTYC